MRKTKIVPQTLKGFQDFLPEDMIARNAIIDTIRSVYERFGFMQIDTPILERFDVLTGSAGLEVNKEIFTLDTPENEPAAIRFDLTVPFARVVSQYRDRIKLPFRRYHIGPVFRADKPGTGRYRQFTQLDADIAGSQSLAADAEVIAVLCEAMRALGLDSAVKPTYRIRISNRKLVDALLLGNGITETDRIKHTLRVIDKLQKVGLENVQLELGGGRVDESGDPIPGVGLSADLIDKILAFISTPLSTRLGMVKLLQSRLPESLQSAEALKEMDELANYLDALGLTEEEAVFDPSLTRGLDYYTGPVFEIEIPTCIGLGSVGGGGRYNELCGRFLSQQVAATGASIGLERLMIALNQLGKLSYPKSKVHVCVATVGKVSFYEVMKIANELRTFGFNTITYLGSKKNMGEQLSDADHYEIPIAVIIGEDELQHGEVSVKNLVAGKELRKGIADHEQYRQAGKIAQVTVKRSEIVATIKTMLLGNSNDY